LGGPVEEKEAEKEDVDMEITWDTGKSLPTLVSLGVIFATPHKSYLPC